MLSSAHVSAVSSCSRGGRPRSSRVSVTRRRPGSTKRCTSRICSLRACRTCCSSSVSADVHRRLHPVVEQVGVPDEDPAAVGDGLAGGALGVQQHVEPAGREVRRAEPVGVVLLLAADHLGRRAQHGREDRRGAGADRGHPPQAEEPAQPRVLDHQLGADRRSGPPATRRCRIRSGSRVATRPVSNHASGRLSLTWTQRLLEQPVVVVDHPRAARRTPWGWTRRRPPRAGARAAQQDCIIPARVLVPLRPAPATNRTFRGSPSGLISSGALPVPVTGGSLQDRVRTI